MGLDTSDGMDSVDSPDGSTMEPEPRRPELAEGAPNTLDDLAEYQQGNFRGWRTMSHSTGERQDSVFDVMNIRKVDRCCPSTTEERRAVRSELAGYRSWNYLKFMTRIHGSVFPEMYTWLLGYGLIAFVATYLNKEVTNVGITDVAHVWTMWPLAFMLVFRVSQAYARFWEGKGHFVNFYFAIRTLARRTFTYIKDTDEGPVDQDSQAMRQNMMRLLLVMAIAVRSNLRKRTLGQLAHDMNMEEVKPYLTAEEHREYSNVVKNRPLLVMAWIGKVINQAHVANKLEGGIILMGFDTDISHMLTGWMGMNKVCYQPMPFMHIHMLHVLLLGWCCSYPFTLVDAYGWWTIPCASGICCILFSLEEVAEEIEDPFGDDLNDLPLEEFELGLKR